jgi:hypothetical protein
MIYRGIVTLFTVRPGILGQTKTTNIKGASDMSEYEAEQLMEQIERWDAKQARHDFIARMERKLDRKDRAWR